MRQSLPPHPGPAGAQDKGGFPFPLRVRTPACQLRTWNSAVFLLFPLFTISTQGGS